jgi:hypothetical protein
VKYPRCAEKSDGKRRVRAGQGHERDKAHASIVKMIGRWVGREGKVFLKFPQQEPLILDQHEV